MAPTDWLTKPGFAGRRLSDFGNRPGWRRFRLTDPVVDQRYARRMRAKRLFRKVTTFRYPMLRGGRDRIRLGRIPICGRTCVK
jgi:hypothetical protein